MCPLQIINDIEPLLLTLHGVHAHFIHQPSYVKNYSINRKLETDQTKQMCIQVIYFYTFLLIFGSKFKIQNYGQSALNGPANGLVVTYTKIQNRLSRAPWDTLISRFLMQYLNNKCALILCDSVKTVVLNF